MNSMSNPINFETLSTIQFQCARRVKNPLESNEQFSFYYFHGSINVRGCEKGLPGVTSSIFNIEVPVKSDEIVTVKFVCREFVFMQKPNGDSHEGYSFSYISKNEFESIFKHVRRERRKKHDEKAWERFLSKKQQKTAQRAENEFDAKADDGFKNIENRVADVTPCKLCQKSAEEAPTIESVPIAKSSSPSKPQKATTPNPATNNGRQESPRHRVLVTKEEKVPASEDNRFFDLDSFDLEFKRVEEQRDKIVSALAGIERLLSQENCKNLDEEEVSRNKIRAAEFAARFKRNYHYQIIRQVTEIQKANSNEQWKKSNHSAAVKKFKSGHQVAVQALQAVEKHLRTNDEGPYNWLHDFLSSVCEMGDLFTSFFHCREIEDQANFKTSCANIARQLEALAIKQRKAPEAKKKKKKHTTKKPETKDNLWMYRNHRDWKSKASELVRLKQAKMNRKKRGEDLENTGERIDEKHYNIVPDNLPDLKMEVKQREGALLRKHVRSVKEDQVRTMMEIVPDVTDSDHDDEKLDVGLFHPLDVAVSKSTDDPVNESPADEEKSNENPPTNLSVYPTNVSYICITRPEEEIIDKPSGLDFENVRKWHKLKRIEAPVATQYRRALQMYQRKLKWYNTDVILFIDRVVDKIYEELMGSVASEINIDHIILNLIEMEARR